MSVHPSSERCQTKGPFPVFRRPVSSRARQASTRSPDRRLALGQSLSRTRPTVQSTVADPRAQHVKNREGGIPRERVGRLPGSNELQRRRFVERTRDRRERPAFSRVRSFQHRITGRTARSPYRIPLSMLARLPLLASMRPTLRRAGSRRFPSARASCRRAHAAQVHLQ